MAVSVEVSLFEKTPYYYSNLADKSIIPDDATMFYCHEQNLYKIPKFPENLEYLYCNNNNLSELPELPKSLISIYANNNRLSELPQLPQSLDYLDCSYNNLGELPELPKSLTCLGCNHNNIKYISPNNRIIIKHIFLGILHNPVSESFTNDYNFQASL